MDNTAVNQYIAVLLTSQVSRSSVGTPRELIIWRHSTIVGPTVSIFTAFRCSASKLKRGCSRSCIAFNTQASRFGLYDGEGFYPYVSPLDFPLDIEPLTIVNNQIPLESRAVVRWPPFNRIRFPPFNIWSYIASPSRIELYAYGSPVTFGGSIFHRFQPLR